MKSVIRFALLAAASFILTTDSLSAQAAAPDQAAFQQFLQQFPKAELPYVIGTTDMSATLEQRAQGVRPAAAAFLAAEQYTFLPDLERSAVATSIPAHPQPVARFETADRYAVLYNLPRNAAKQYRALYLAVYDKQGNHIATTFVAGANPTTLVSAVLNEQLQANVQEFQVQWAKEPGQSLAGNQLTGLQSLGIQSLDLNQAPTAEWNERHEPKTLASGALARNDSK